MSEIVNNESKEVKNPLVENYKNIKPEKDMSPKEVNDFWDSEFNKAAEEAKTEGAENTRQRNLPRKGGEWTGKPGESAWKPDPDVVPGDGHKINPEHKTWREIMEKYDFSSILFQDGVPDFAEVSKDKVEISDFTDNRASNFNQADENLSKQWGCTPEDVAQWRKENRYTWHECIDCKTMQLVPTDVHGNIPHSGGISEYKSRQKLV